METRKLMTVGLCALLIGAIPSAASANRGGAAGPPKPEAETTEAGQADTFGDAVAALDKGEYEQAIALFTAVVESEPDNADAFNHLGYIHRQLQSFDDAFRYYRRALEINPEHTGAHHYIGEAYLEVDRLDMAEQHLRQLDIICLFGCDDFYELKEAVELYRVNHTS